MSANRMHNGARTFHDVLGFAWRPWQRQPWLVPGIAAAMMAATVSDVLMPVFAGRLVDAVGLIDADRDAARREALAALAAILALGVVMVVMRFLTFRGIIRLTLRIMAAIAQEAFWRVQRFSTEWHANTFGGSVVRRLTRGMWAMDLLNDTLLVALLPSVVVLLATTVLLGLRWPAMGLVVAAGSVAFLGLSVTGTLLYVAYVLTSYFVIHGYLRDVGFHIGNLQRSVNEMEELVAMQAEPLGVQDRAAAPAIKITSGAVLFDRVTFRYGVHPQPLFQQ